MKSPERSSCEYLDSWRGVQLHATRQIIKIIRLDNASVNSTCPPPPGYFGEFARLVSPGDGAFANFALPGGRAFANPGGHSRAFDTHSVSYQNITTRMVLLEEKQIGSSVKDRDKLKRVGKASSRFYACISSLLIEPKLHSEIGAIDVNQRFLVVESNFC